ncbi:MAG: quinolinate synthase NadA [Candidatus Thermoplasmatota archaeon]
MNKKDIQDRIIELKKELNAIILAHNYQISEVQDIADFIGDSLDLSLKATKTEAEVIIFCGVDFMAESAKILNPDKKVIIPDKTARCPMAAMVDVESLSWLKKDHPDADVVAYINTTADIKAVSDICCTSANAVNVINSLTSKKVIFVPDRNLGLYTKRFIKDKEIIIWPGICSTHHNITKEEVLELKRQHPEAEIIVHPECRPEVIDISDHAFSTMGMVRYVGESKSREFIIGTEKEMCYRLKKDYPSKEFYHVGSAICPNMKKINIEKIYKSMKCLKPEVIIPSDIMERAKTPLERMMMIKRGG